MTGSVPRLLRAAGRLLPLCGGLVLAGWGLLRLADGAPAAVWWWLLGAVLGHDLVFVPLYTLADRALRAVCGRTGRGAVLHGVLRVPAVLSGLLLLVSFPLVLRLDPGPYEGSSGFGVAPFLWHWLGVSAALFAVSAAARGLRLLLRRRSPGPPRPDGGGRGRR